MKYKMLVMDMDDTLLREDLTISDKVKKKLAQAEEMGVIVVLASGRVPYAMHRYIKELDLDKREGYVISGNGSYIIETDTFEIVHEEVLPTEFALEVYERIQSMELPVQIYVDDTIYVSFDNGYTDIDCQLTGLKKGIMKDTVDFIKSHKVSKFVIPDDPEKLLWAKDELADLYSDRANIFISKPYFLEIMPENTDKGHALEKLSDILNIDKSAIIAVGDAQNDLGMIKTAGLGIAVKNAVDDVKEAADIVLNYTNEEDAVAKVIDLYMGSNLL